MNIDSNSDNNSKIYKSPKKINIAPQASNLNKIVKVENSESK
jgi:hypothetical protein